MKRLAAAFAVLALGACAADQQSTAQTAPTAPAAAKSKSVQAPGGEWVVADDFAAQPVGTLASPYRGARVVLEPARAVDAAGRLCKAPQYSESLALPEVTLGHPAQPQAARDHDPRRTLTVTCEGAAFAALVAQPDGGWLVRQDAWVLKLAKAPATAQAEPAAAPVIALPVATAPAPEPVKAAPKRDPRTLVYLASYPTEARAKTGYRVLAKVSPQLAKGQAITQNVDLGKKGKWVRLYGMAADEGERKTICTQLGKRVDECGARNRE